MAYTQAYLDFLTQCDPFNVKFMDETGIQMPAVGNRSYGHSPKGETCIELQRYAKSRTRHFMLVGINGICYANVIQGPSNTDSFLQFFGEASNAAAPDGEPAIRPGDIIVVDNCPIHHHDGGRALAVFLDNMGVEYVFAPVYSPDINPVEYLFNDLKIRLKMYQSRDTLRRNTEFAVYHALSTIGAAECYGYYKHVGIFRL
ncbi:uncharacterized protein [Ptychodera flava]|uniref:uncharacterized protein n=1 Tax=Ptychodera flava TaxID=63121 RepID=UPI00396AA3F4